MSFTRFLLGCQRVGNEFRGDPAALIGSRCHGNEGDRKGQKKKQPNKRKRKKKQKQNGGGGSPDPLNLRTGNRKETWLKKEKSSNQKETKLIKDWPLPTSHSKRFSNWSKSKKSRPPAPHNGNKGKLDKTRFKKSLKN